MMAKVCDYPQRSGTVYGFSDGDPVFIGDVMRDLHLRCPLDFWLWVSHGIKTLKMSEATVDFLIMLDIMRSSSRPRRCYPERIAEFLCEDEVQMKTYSDLVSKIYQAHPETSGILKSESFFCSARDFLACCGIEDDRDLFASCVGTAERKAIEAGFCTVEKKQLQDISVAVGERRPAGFLKKRHGTLICMLSSCSEADDAVLELLSDRSFGGRVLRAKQIENGLLDTLLDFSCGFSVTVDNTEGMSYPLAELCTDFSGLWLVEILPDELDALRVKGAERAVLVTVVARTQKKREICFFFPAGTYRLNPDFILGATRTDARETVCAASAEPLTPPVFNYAGYRDGAEDFYYLSDHVTTGCAYYDASSAVVSAVSKAVAAGNDPSRLRLTNLIITDKNHASGIMPPRLVSYVLGLYRAQMELCLPDAGSSVEPGHMDRLTVIATGEGRIAQDRVRCGTVYLAIPALSEEGFPRYEELRRIFRFVYGAVTTGRCRAEAIDARGAQAALARLCCGSEWNGMKEVEYVPGSFLLLTEEKIEGLEVLGHFEGETQCPEQD